MEASKPEGAVSFTERGNDGVSIRGSARASAVSRAGELPEFLDLVFASRYRLVPTVVIGGILACLFVAIVVFIFQPRYTAHGLVRVREHGDVVFAPQTSRAADIAFFHAQEKLALSPQVLSAAVDKLLADNFGDIIPDHDEADWLRGLLDVDTQAGSEVLRISASHTSPHFAQAAANAVTEAYLNEVLSRINRDRQLREQELERAALTADQRLDELWAQLNAVAESIGSDNSRSLTIRDELQYQAYRDYSGQLRSAQLRGNELQRLLAEQQLKIDEELDDEVQVAESLIQDHADVSAARKQLFEIEKEIGKVRQIAARENVPKLERLIAERELQEAQLNQIVDRVREQIREQTIKQSLKDRENTLAQLKQKIELNRDEKDFLRTRLSEIETGITRTEDSTGIRLDMSRHAVDRQTRLADSLWQSLQELRIESRSQPRAALLQLAQLPGYANRGRQLKAAGAAGMAGFLIAILGVGYCEWRECRIRCKEDVTNHSQLPVFGSPSAAGTAWWRGKSTSFDNGAREAAATIVLNARQNPLPTVMISSSASREPRGWVGWEVASAFSQLRRRTLLIECDANQTQLARMLNAEGRPGLRQLSADSANPGRYIVSTPQRGMDFLPIGPGEQPNAWINPHVLESIIRAARRDYQAIVVSGPAMTSSAESLLLAARADLVLLAVTFGRSRWSELAAAEQSAARSGISIGGIVLHSGKPSIVGFADVAASEPHIPDIAESENESSLHNQISELQLELQQAQSAHRASDKDVRPSQEVSA